MVIRRREITGKAVKKLSEDLRKSNPETPWKKIAGMRDVLTMNTLVLTSN
jgi:uncharacterized protein with HEPN domain